MRLYLKHSSSYTQLLLLSCDLLPAWKRAFIGLVNGSLPSLKTSPVLCWEKGFLAKGGGGWARDLSSFVYR